MLDPLNVMKAPATSPVSLSNVWVSCLIFFPYQQSQARVETNAPGCALYEQNACIQTVWEHIQSKVSAVTLRKFTCRKNDFITWLRQTPIFVLYQCSFNLDCVITFFFFFDLHPCILQMCRFVLAPLQQNWFPQIVSSHSQRRKQEVLVAMAQYERYVQTNTTHWHLAKSVVAVWTAPQMCRHVCVSPRLCQFSCPLNVSLPPTVCLLPDGWMVCTGGSWSTLTEQVNQFRFLKTSSWPNINSAADKN